MNTLVSVIIPCFNCERYLAAAVGSVLAQSYPDWECLLVDDGSTDATPAVARRLAAEDPRVRYLPKAHGGVSAARNYGIDRARGEWVQFLDSDDLLHPDKLRFQLAHAMGAGADAAVLYSDYDVRWETPDGDILRVEERIVGARSEAQLLDSIMRWNFRPDSPLHSNSALFRRTAFEQTRYDEQMWGFEDLALFVELLVRGVRFVYTPIRGMSYRIHTTNMTKDRAKVVHAYTRYLETVARLDPRLLQSCPTIGPLLKRAIGERDRTTFRHLLRLVEGTGVPVYLGKRGACASPRLLRLWYWLAVLFPVQSSRNMIRRCRNRLLARRGAGAPI